MHDVDKQESEALESLEPRFMLALQAKQAGKLDDAEDELRAILRIEPRLAEPRMELARILLDTDRLHDAEEHAREALIQLEAGGQWIEEIQEEVVLALAHALLAEVLRRHADDDDLIFGDPEKFHAVVEESQQHFEAASKLDPSNEYASYYAFFMGPQQDEDAGAP